MLEVLVQGLDWSKSIFRTWVMMRVSYKPQLASLGLHLSNPPKVTLLKKKTRGRAQDMVLFRDQFGHMHPAIGGSPGAVAAWRQRSSGVSPKECLPTPS